MTPSASPNRVSRVADLLWGSRSRRTIVAALIGLTVVAYAVLAYVRHERAAERAQLAAEVWDRIRVAADRQDAVGVRAGLDSVESLTPHDPALARWRATLRSGEADPADQGLLRFVLNEHLAADRLADAAREAGKRLAAKPRDWLANCVLAHHALAAGRFDEARERLAALLPPAEAEGGVGPGPLLYALRLQSLLGQPVPPDWSGYLVRVVLPALERSATNATRAEKFQLLDAHATAHDFLDSFPDLGRSWVPAAALGQALLAEPGLTPADLQRLARLFERQRGVLERLERHGNISVEEAGRLRAELTDRTAAAWARLRDAVPTDSAGHLGVASCELRAGRTVAARAAVEGGIEVCGPRSELLAGMAQVLRVTDPAASVEPMVQAVRLRPEEPALWQALADVALTAGRPDLAAAAADEALRLRAELYPPRLTAARARLAQGRPTDAAAVLAAAKPALLRDPAAAALYVRALYEAGAASLADDFLAEADTADKSAAVLAAGAAELLRIGQPDEALRWAERATRRDPDSRDARRVVADALRTRAESSVPVWDAGRVAEAVRAYEWLVRRDPADLVAANNLAWLQLKGQGDTAAAAKSAIPLLAREADLSPDMAETLGSVLLAAGDARTAVRVLERAIGVRPARPGLLTHLALAYHAIGLPRDAKAVLGKAAEFPRNERETAEFLAAWATVHGMTRPAGRP